IGSRRDPQSLEASRLREEVANDADDLSFHIEHRAPRISLVYRGICLKHLYRPQSTHQLLVRVARAQVSGRQSSAQSVRSADYEDLIAHLRLIGITQPGDDGVGGNPFEF